MTYAYPPYTASERETLVGYLDYYRAIMLDKASGLDADQANTTLAPSNLTLISLVHHLAIVEHWWFHVFFAGNEPSEPWAEIWGGERDWEFNHSHEFEPEAILDRYRKEVERANGIIAGADTLDQLSIGKRNDQSRSLRWILAHMLEETARHAGHADLIRESIDGTVGDFRDG